ncbi:hypothetical protein BC349_16255 [Flavihumibacter stibioxidans]|uniref:Two component regulator three Y domain-containing protein n=1 Tax=Flavihumibacter stibioxidans TaxID=1834163 RepID=A0ABR7MC51_9BACT|nr:hypothetical protein [Flavihumibacter stibioxidans]
MPHRIKKEHKGSPIQAIPQPITKFSQFIQADLEKILHYRFITFDQENPPALTHFYTCLTALIVFTTCLRAQPPSYLYSHLGKQDGLVSDQLMIVQQDKKGYIWIASHHGIQRFDGHRFLDIRHRPGVPGSIPPGIVYLMAMDKKDRLWLVFGDFKVGYLDVSDLSFHEVNIKFPDKNFDRGIGNIYIDEENNIFLFGYKRTVFTFREKDSIFLRSNSLFRVPKGWNIIHLWQDKQYNYWLGCDSGLAKFNKKTQMLSYAGHNPEKEPVIEKFSKLKVINLLYKEPGGRFWISSWPETGLTIQSYDPATGMVSSWEHVIGAKLKYKYFELRGITTLQDGSTWLAGHNLFARFNPAGSTIDPVPNSSPGENSILFDGVNQLYEDREKNVWICTDKGLYRFNPSAQKFSVIHNRRFGRDTLFSPDVTDLLHSSSGNIYVSTWGSGVFAYDQKFNPVNSLLVKQGINMGELMTWCILERNNGEIWRGQQGGTLVIYDPASQKTRIIRDPVFENSTIRQIAEDRDGNVWCGTQRGYLIKWNAATGQFTVQHKLEGIISRLYLDKTGYLWVCNAINGVYRIRPQTGEIVMNINTLGPDDKKLLANATSDILQYDDSLFAIAANGLNILNLHTGKIKHHNTNNGFPSNEIANFSLDPKGYLWMSSGSGIISFNIRKNKISNYSAMDGIHTNSFSTASVGLLRDGRIVIGTSHDMLVFDPLQVTVEDYTPPKVEISGISLMNKALPVDSVRKSGKLELRHDQNSLILEFTTLTYQNDYGIYYKLVGLDKEWKESGKLKQALFNYLAPGDYTLNVASRKADGQIGQITSLTISVSAPFWRSTWFYSLLALAFAAVLFWLDKQRTSRLENEARMRSAIAGNLHDEVNTTLLNINVLSEIAGMKASTDPEKSKEFIYEIQKKSRNMVIAMKDVLWSIDPANDSMPKTIERFHEVAEAMRNRHGAEVFISTGTSIGHLQLSMKFRHEFIIIFKTAITCLVETMQGKLVRVELDYLKGCLQMKITAPGLKPDMDNEMVSRCISDIKARARTLGTVADTYSNEEGVVFSFKARTGHNGIQKI